MPLTNPTTTIVAHTPGPWSIRDIDGDPFIVAPTDGTDHPLSLLDRYSGAPIIKIGEIYDGPDARLVAAAPELLTALADAIALAEDAIPYVSEYLQKKWGYAEELAGLKAVLAKATGEQP